MALSPKQLAMAWINEKLDPSRIEVEDSELNKINGKHLSQEVIAKARQFVMEDLAKVKVRYQQYTEKYVGETNGVDKTESEREDEREHGTGGAELQGQLHEVPQPDDHRSDAGTEPLVSERVSEAG